MRPLMYAGLIGLLALGLVLAGCSSPGASAAADASAKRFAANPGEANLYLYRDNRILGAAVSWDVALDGKELGRLPIRSFMLVQVKPGAHTVSRFNGTVSEQVTVQGGKNYFARIGSSHIEIVSQDEGRSMVSKCKRVEAAR